MCCEVVVDQVRPDVGYRVVGGEVQGERYRPVHSNICRCLIDLNVQDQNVVRSQYASQSRVGKDVKDVVVAELSVKSGQRDVAVLVESQMTGAYQS